MPYFVSIVQKSLKITEKHWVNQRGANRPENKDNPDSYICSVLIKN